MADRSGTFRGVLFILLATLLWGSSFVVTKGAVDAFPTVLLVTLRLLIGGGIAALICLKKLKNTSKGLLAACSLLGILYAAGLLLQTMGVEHTSAGRTAFVSAAYCIFTPFIEWAVIKHRPRFKNLLAAAVCLCGIGLIVLDGGFTIDSGDLYTLACALSLAFEIVLFGKFVEKYDPDLLNTFMLLFAGVLTGILSLCTEQLPATLHADTAGAILYLAVLCTGIPMLLQGSAQKLIVPTVVTIVLGFEPVFAAIFSAVFLKESFSGRALIGAMLVFVSAFVAVVIREKKGNTEKGRLL